MKILILYHSGSGSTGTICRLLHERLSDHGTVDIHEITFDFNYRKLDDYDLLLFGFPTYHCRPSQSTIDFIENMPVFKTNIKAYLVATCGLYLGNTMRIAAKSLLKKNIFTAGYMPVRGPGSDELLYSVPSWLKFVFTYEKKVSLKIDTIVSETSIITEDENAVLKMPFFKWYAPLNDLFSFFGEKNYERYKKNIHILTEKCTKCNICLNNCIRKCFTPGDETPVYNFKNCEFCLRCIHNCPSEAIVFSSAMINRPRLNKKFYSNLKNKIYQKNKVYRRGGI